MTQIKVFYSPLTNNIKRHKTLVVSLLCKKWLNIEIVLTKICDTKTVLTKTKRTLVLTFKSYLFLRDSNKKIMNRFMRFKNVDLSIQIYHICLFPTIYTKTLILVKNYCGSKEITFNQKVIFSECYKTNVRPVCEPQLLWLLNVVPNNPNSCPTESADQ